MRKGLLIALVLAMGLFLLPRWMFAQHGEAGMQNATRLELGKVVVSATRLETPLREVASSMTVIDEQEIEQRQARTATEVLRSVPALDVVQTGGPGGQTSVSIRGAESDHTLVLIDGVEMNDPSDLGRSFNFASLSTENIERIEILRGPQSTLYGSDAIGGVINIVTKKGKGKPSGLVSAEGGSFQTYRQRAQAGGATELINYSLGFSRLDTEGISAADEDDGNEEEDGYENTTLSARLGITPTEHFQVSSIMRYIDDETDLDDSGGVGGDDPNHRTESERLFLRAQAQLSLFENVWEQEIGFSYTDHDRRTEDDPDASQPNELLRSSFDGEIVQFDWQHDVMLHETNTLTFGVETEEDTVDYRYYLEDPFFPVDTTIDDKSMRTTGFYAQDQIRLWDSWFTTVGVRVDDHEDFGTETTYRITSTYLVHKTGTKIKGTLGTGFKAPTLYQLYSQYGNRDLDPEESTGWDIGLEQSLIGDRVSVGVTYFYNDFDELIDFDVASSRYFNTGAAETQGVELSSSVRPIDSLTVKASYTYTDTEDKSTGDELLRRPEDKFSLNVNYSFLGQGNLNLGLSYVGSRNDVGNVELQEYSLAHLAASYQVLDNVELFGRIENLLDEDYQEISGYGTPELSAFAGVRLSL
jgi:vitamin B12 transporter